MPTAGHSPARPTLARWAGAAFLCALMLALLALADASQAAVLGAERSIYASSSAPVGAAAKVATGLPSRHACAVGRRIGACRAGSLRNTGPRSGARRNGRSRSRRSASPVQAAPPRPAPPQGPN